MAYSFIGAGSNLSGAFTSSMTMTAFALNTGDHVVVCVNTSFGQDVASITDTAGNNYVKDVTGTSNNSRIQSMWSAENCIANASNIITINFTGIQANSQAHRIQRSGMLSSGAFNGTGDGNSSGSATVTNNLTALTTTIADSEIVDFAGEEDLGDTWTPPTGFTQRQIDSATICITSTKVVSATQSSVTITTTGTTTSFSKRKIIGAYGIESSGTSVNVTPDTGPIVLVGLAPTINISDNKNVSPGIGPLVLAGLVPAVSVSDNKNVSPGIGPITLDGLAPTVSTGGAINVSPGIGPISLAGLAPVVTVTGPAFSVFQIKMFNGVSWIDLTL